MNRKGFTLIELLAVIIILSIILAITTLIVTDTMDKAREDTDKIDVSQSLKAAELWFSENMYDDTDTVAKNCRINMPTSCKVNLTYLKQKSYLKKTDLGSNPGCVEISIDENKSYEYAHTTIGCP